MGQNADAVRAAGLPLEPDDFIACIAAVWFEESHPAFGNRAARDSQVQWRQSAGLAGRRAPPHRQRASDQSDRRVPVVELAYKTNLGIKSILVRLPNCQHKSHQFFPVQ